VAMDVAVCSGLEANGLQFRTEGVQPVDDQTRQTGARC